MYKENRIEETENLKENPKRKTKTYTPGNNESNRQNKKIKGKAPRKKGKVRKKGGKN